MSNYVKSTNFTAKDSLPTGDTNKVIRGSEFDTEFNAIVTAIATKSDLAGPTFTGTATFADITGTGTINFTGATVSNLGSVTTVDINGGTIDGVTIGGSSAGAGTFSSLTATTADINGGSVDGVTIGGSSAGAGTFSSLTATTADINAGTVDNTVIGGTTPAAGTFSSLTATTANIDGGSIDGAVIGGSTPAAISGTTGTFSGAVSGTTGTFSGAVTGSNLNISNWDTAFGWGDHSTEGYLTSVTFSDMDAGAITTSGETFANSDTQIPTNAAVRNWVLTAYPTIVENNDLTANVTWATVPDAYISESSVTQHVTLEKATQSKTYTNGEVSELTLSKSITSGVPVVSVTKEVAQTGLTNNNWDVATDGTNYDLENSAYATTLTPSDASADGTFTLGSGSFAADDVGKIVSGNGGTAIILNTSGDYNLLTNFTDTSAIASGSWTLKEMVVDGAATGFALASGLETVAGFVNSLNVAYYSGKSFSVASEDSVPNALVFNADGTKMYMLGSLFDGLFQYSLSTAFDITTASYDSVSFSFTSQDTVPQDIAFNNDGTKLYMTGTSSDSVHQYSLSTAFDLSTISYDSVSFSVASQDGSPNGLTFNNDGTKMYVIGNTNDTVFQYSLSTAFDVSTASYDSISLNVSGQDATPEAIIFNSDGTELYILGRSSLTVYKYYLTTAYDLSTAGYSLVSFNASGQETAANGLAFNTDFSKMYIVGQTSDTVFEYNLNADFNLNALDYSGKSFSVLSEESNARELAFNTDGTKMYIVGNSSDSVHQYSLSTGFDVSTASYDSVSLSVNGQDTSPSGLTFNNDGTKMYMVGYGTDTVYEYDLSTGFDLSTASYNSVSFSVASQATQPHQVIFNDDGTKMYVIGATTAAIYQYSLSTAFDLSTASYDSVSLNISGQDSQGRSIAFNNDGTTLFFFGNANDNVHQYRLSTAYDLSTATYLSITFNVGSVDGTGEGITFNNDGSKMFVVCTSDKVYEFSIFNTKAGQPSGNSYVTTSEENAPYGIRFNNDGTKMYIMGRQNDEVHQYSLSTAFDISTVSYDSVSFSVASQETAPNALVFNSDGTKMYIVGSVNDTVYQYSLSTAFDVSTASYDSVSLAVSGDGITSAHSLRFNSDGTKLFVCDFSAADVGEYALSTAYDLSTAVFAIKKDFSQGTSSLEMDWVTDLAFNEDGTILYLCGNSQNATIGNQGTVARYTLSTGFSLASTVTFQEHFITEGTVGNFARSFTHNNDFSKIYLVTDGTDTIHEFNLGSADTQSPVVYSSDYAVAVTNSSGQVDSTYFTDINSTTTTESVGTGEAYYAYSVDNHVTWKVIHNTNGERSIARNNGGTWEYNSNATYASTTWTSATTNSEVGALKQALSVAANQMTGTQFDAVTDANHLTLSTTMDFMIALKNADSTSTSPTSDGVSFNYDAASLNQGAVLGTDYNWDFPAADKVRITSLADQNLKVRII